MPEGQNVYFIPDHECKGQEIQIYFCLGRVRSTRVQILFIIREEGIHFIKTSGVVISLPDLLFIHGSGYVPEKDYPTVSYRFLSTV